MSVPFQELRYQARIARSFVNSICPINRSGDRRAAFRLAELGA
jgi:hypothetical protein